MYETPGSVLHKALIRIELEKEERSMLKRCACRKRKLLCVVSDSVGEGKPEMPKVF